MNIARGAVPFHDAAIQAPRQGEDASTTSGFSRSSWAWTGAASQNMR